MKDNDYGQVIDASTVRFERLLPGPIERVWAYLTESDKRGRWLASGETGTSKGAAVELVFRNNTLTPGADDPPPDKYRDIADEVRFSGTVLRFEPPRVLVHTWDFMDEHSEVTYELEERGDKVRLVLTHRRLEPPDTVPGVAAGWHTHLDILADVLAGRTPKPFWRTLSALEGEYGKRTGD